MPDIGSHCGRPGTKPWRALRVHTSLEQPVITGRPLEPLTQGNWTSMHSGGWGRGYGFALHWPINKTFVTCSPPPWDFKLHTLEQIALFYVSILLMFCPKQLTLLLGHFSKAEQLRGQVSLPGAQYRQMGIECFWKPDCSFSFICYVESVLCHTPLSPHGVRHCVCKHIERCCNPNAPLKLITVARIF